MFSNSLKNVCLRKDCLVFQDLFRPYKEGNRFLLSRPRFETRNGLIKIKFMNTLQCTRKSRLEFEIYKCGCYGMEREIIMRTTDLSHSNDKSFISYVFTHSILKSQATYHKTSQE